MRPGIFVAARYTGVTFSIDVEGYDLQETNRVPRSFWNLFGNWQWPDIMARWSRFIGIYYDILWYIHIYIYYAGYIICNSTNCKMSHELPWTSGWTGIKFLSEAKNVGWCTNHIVEVAAISQMLSCLCRGTHPVWVCKIPSVAHHASCHFVVCGNPRKDRKVACHCFRFACHVPIFWGGCYWAYTLW